MFTLRIRTVTDTVSMDREILYRDAFAAGERVSVCVSECVREKEFTNEEDLFMQDREKERKQCVHKLYVAWIGTRCEWHIIQTFMLAHFVPAMYATYMLDITPNFSVCIYFRLNPKNDRHLFSLDACLNGARYSLLFTLFSFFGYCIFFWFGSLCCTNHTDIFIVQKSSFFSFFVQTWTWSECKKRRELYERTCACTLIRVICLYHHCLCQVCFGVVSFWLPLFCLCSGSALVHTNTYDCFYRFVCVVL